MHGQLGLDQGVKGLLDDLSRFRLKEENLSLVSGWPSNPRKYCGQIKRAGSFQDKSKYGLNFTWNQDISVAQWWEVFLSKGLNFISNSPFIQTCHENTRNHFPTLRCTLYLLYCRVKKLWLCCNLLHLLTKAVLDFHQNLTYEDHVLADVVDVVGVSKDEIDVELPSLLLARQLDVHPRLQEALLPPLQHSDTVLQNFLRAKDYKSCFHF